MELRQLRYFVAIAEAGSLARASDRLHVAQPALSVHLANIEAEVGLRLVNRSNREIELTEDGQLLYERALVTLRYHAESIRTLKERRTLPRGPVSLGIISTLPDLLAGPICRAVRERLAEVELYVAEGSTAVLYEWLQEGRLDFAILFNLPDNIGLDTAPLFMEEYCLVSRPDLAPDSAIVEFDDIFELPLVIPCKSSVWRKLLDETAQRHGKILKPVIETESCSFSRAIALSGAGHAVLPRSGVLEAVAGGALRARKIVNPGLDGLVSLASLSAAEPSRAQTAVRGEIVRIARDLASQSQLISSPQAVAPAMRTLPGDFLPFRRRTGPAH